MFYVARVLVVVVFFILALALHRERRAHAYTRRSLAHWRAQYVELIDAVRQTGHVSEVRKAVETGRALASSSTEAHR